MVIRVCKRYANICRHMCKQIGAIYAELQTRYVRIYFPSISISIRRLFSAFDATCEATLARNVDKIYPTRLHPELQPCRAHLARNVTGTDTGMDVKFSRMMPNALAFRCRSDENLGSAKVKAPLRSRPAKARSKRASLHVRSTGVDALPGPRGHQVTVLTSGWRWRKPRREEAPSSSPTMGRSRGFRSANLIARLNARD